LQRSKLRFDATLSNFADNVNLRRYTAAPALTATNYAARRALQQSDYFPYEEPVDPLPAADPAQAAFNGQSTRRIVLLPSPLQNLSVTKRRRLS